jgi:hypothetical protein
MHNLLPEEPVAVCQEADACAHVPERDTMLMTQLAILDAGESKPRRFERLTRQLARLFGFSDDPILPSLQEPESASDPAGTLSEPVLRIVSPEREDADAREATTLRWRRHPQLLDQKEPSLSGNEREARHEAVRGLFAARAGALQCAESHFARAAACDEIDLSAIPGFWQLDRSAMMTAVEAYERAGRIRESSALNARIRTMYRPRSLTPVPSNVRHLPQSASKASSNS